TRAGVLIEPVQGAALGLRQARIRIEPLPESRLRVGVQPAQEILDQPLRRRAGWHDGGKIAGARLDVRGLVDGLPGPPRGAQRQRAQYEREPEEHDPTERSMEPRIGK